jgi:hypothetical protein
VIGRRLLVGPTAATAAVVLLLGVAIPSTVAAEPAFGKPTLDAVFGEGITITQPVTLDGPPARVELLLRTTESEAPLVIEVPAPISGGAVTLRHRLSEGDDGHILPNSPIEARWRVTGADGTVTVGPVATDVYDDQRFDWQTVEGDVVRVHWYEGGDAFGARALEIGQDAVADTARLLGVTESEPVDFFIYADQDAFYDALGPGTRENVGGQANAGIRTLFALIGPRDIDDPWVGIVVPHELVHLVFDTAVSNPYHFPPRWLNEGLAVYLSQGYTPSDRAAVEAAARGGDLLPLDGLDGQFPTSAERFYLAYAESVSAVDYLIRTHGQDALVSLISSYADGRTDDEAFSAAIGQDLAAFDAAWLADLGTGTPVRYGPQDAPAGPEPAAWADAGGPVNPGAGGATPGPDAPIATPAVGSPAVGAADAGPVLIVGALAALGVIVAVAVLAARRRRSSRTDGQEMRGEP